MKLLHTFFLAASAIYTFVTAQEPKYVFAHMVVGDTAAHDVTTWGIDISLAQAAAIDAFALNIAYGDPNVPTQVANAFSAAAANGYTFKLFFSFDYLGGTGPWPAEDVASYLNEYKSHPAYFLYTGIPFVGTFEGPDNAGDWAPGGTIRSSVGDLYFVPTWTSIGATGVAGYADSIQGAFPWAMWLVGANNMTDGNDLYWQATLPGKTYMMGVSPWFFHSTTYGGSVPWVERGDDLWATRWAETLDVNPDFVEIVTWNDFAESTYIGPIHFESEIVEGSGVYVDNMPHESWRDFLPYYIATYKGYPFDIVNDQMQYWYRLSPTSAGSTCGVQGNAVYEPTISPNLVLEDGIFFSALLNAPATVTVAIGDNTPVQYAGVAGINHWSQPFNGQTGEPSFIVSRPGQPDKGGAAAWRAPISDTPLSNGCINYNAWVGSWQF